MSKDLNEELKKADKVYAVIRNNDEDGIPVLLLAVSDIKSYEFRVMVLCQCSAALKKDNQHVNLEKDTLGVGYVYSAIVKFDGAIHAYFKGEDYFSRDEDSYYYCVYGYICDAIIAVSKIAKLYFKDKDQDNNFDDYGYGEAFDKEYSIKEIDANTYDYENIG